MLFWLFRAPRTAVAQWSAPSDFSEPKARDRITTCFSQVSNISGIKGISGVCRYQQVSAGISRYQGQSWKVAIVTIQIAGTCSVQAPTGFVTGAAVARGAAGSFLFERE